MNIAPPANLSEQQLLPWFTTVSRLLTQMTQSGVTADRPTVNLWTGRPYFDTTLGQPIWYDGTGWVDATGTAA